MRLTPIVLTFALLSAPNASAQDVLPNTQPLDWTGDIASRLVDGVDRFLLKETDKAIANRERFWKRDFSSSEAYTKSVEPNRKRRAHILGVRDTRVPFDVPELVSTTQRPALVGKSDKYDVFAIRWPVLGEMHGEGLLLSPRDAKPIADVVVIPDVSQTPESLVGLSANPPSDFANRLAARGCRVVIPTLINREPSSINKIPNREYLYRSAFELGRHVIGYEVQKVLACVDWFTKEANGNANVGVIGWGEGGMLALYAAALDPRIDSAAVSGYFGERKHLWQEPIDRNVFGLLEQFGDAEIASLIFPRSLLVEAVAGPTWELPVKTGGAAPGRLKSPDTAEARREWQRHIDRLKDQKPAAFREYDSPNAKPFAGRTLNEWCSTLGLKPESSEPSGTTVTRVGDLPNPALRHERQRLEIEQHNAWLLSQSAETRRQFMAKLDTKTPQRYAETVEPYRQFFADEVIGRFDQQPLPFNPRSRKSYDNPRWTGYEVVLDVFPDVVAYGILLLPKDLKEGEKRPVVVCQHGLEGRPQDIIKGDHPAYHDFAAKLAERGFITFSPQNLYIFTDRFRSLQRKANPIRKTLFSVIVPQHQQITDWLKTLPNVDPERIAFYGLSYGGKTAMRVPPLVKNYCLSICSADFNEWVWKNASTRNPYTYTKSGEYEIFEFDLGSTFNYAEMAALIAPRPFMVERGHFDGVAPDETVAFEFAKVRNLYQARLGLMDRCEIEWFVGPHTINGKGTYAFLHKHLKWPVP